ncbi:MAG: 50S ribosomal protein L11 methyltransferase [Mariprofundales bacterium]|nr:50S ribosomal protein L11 methyltransferase [Mariprofundales bacterium]
MTTPLIELEVDAAALDEEPFNRLADQLHAAGRASEMDPSGQFTRHQAWFTPQPGVWEQLIAATSLLALPAASVKMQHLDESWETAWQAHWKPLAIGRRLWVRPSFCPAAAAGMIDIELTPGMAFGTGTHATTGLCLTAIESLFDAHHPESLLDMGTGSGILAIAAAKLGVQRVLAIDCDADSVTACIDNARINGVTIDSELGNAPPTATRFDLVVANILSEPLIAMAPQLTTCVGRDLLLSGLLHDQEAAVVAAYAAVGLHLSTVSRQLEWSALHLIREGGA